MVESNSFEKFKKLNLDILKQTGNCIESQQLFGAAQSVAELVSVWLHFWANMLDEVPQQLVSALKEVYSDYKEDINSAGVYFNEAPNTAFGNEKILIGDDVDGLEIHGNYSVYVLGCSSISVYDHSQVYVYNEGAKVGIYDNVICYVTKGTVIAHDRAIVNGQGNLTCYDSTTINISDGVLEDHGHLQINAHEKAVVNSFTTKGIKIFGHAKLNVIK